MSDADPEWDEWTPWSTCTVQDCGAGWSSRSRTCRDNLSGDIVDSHACGVDDIDEARCDGVECPSMYYLLHL